jgi:hypothetical protein
MRRQIRPANRRKQTKSKKKESGMKIRLEDGQIQYLVGGNQVKYNDSGEGEPETTSWGKPIGNPTIVPIATSMSHSLRHGWGQSHINFFAGPTPDDSRNIIGGFQLNNNIDSSEDWVQTRPAWGFRTDETKDIAQAQSFTTHHDFGWGNGEMHVCYATGYPWLTLVGGYQEFNNMDSTAEWVKVPWGLQTGIRGLFGEFKAYSKYYRWGNSRVVLCFAED